MFRQKSKRVAENSTSGGGSKAKSSSAGATGGKKKKKNVIEIDGQPWLCDASGKPVKKLRKKGGKPDPEEPVAARGSSSSPTPPPPPPSGTTTNSGKKKKKNVIEIDGQPWLCDASGKPVKKLKKKGGKMQRRKSAGGALDHPSGGRGRQAAPDNERRRAKSVGSKKQQQQSDDDEDSPSEPPGRVQRKEFLDNKGRRVIIEEDGSKTVIDKNGKRLRKKQKAPPPKPVSVEKEDDDDSVFSSGIMAGGESFFQNIGTPSVRGSGMFDKLWDDDKSAKAGSNFVAASAQRDRKNGLSGILEANSDHETKNGDGDDGGDDQHTNGEDTAGDSIQSSSLSAKISQYGKENRELQLKVMAKEDEVQELSEQNKKEKAKNVKAMTEMMQLKADFHEASSELRELRNKVKDLQATIDAKEKEVQELQSGDSPREPRDSRIWRARHDNPGGEEKKNERPDTNHGDEGDNGGAPRCASCGAGNKEVQDLFAENRALQRKVEFEKTNAQHEMKKKEDRIAFLTKELAEIREDLELFVKGEKGDGKANPMMARLLKEKKDIELKYNQEKEVNSIRIEGMQEMIESLTMINGDLKKQLDKEYTGGNGSGGGDDDDGSLDMNYVTDGIKEDTRTAFGNQAEDPNNPSMPGGFFSKFRGGK